MPSSLMGERIQPEELRLVDFLNGCNIFFAYSENTRSDFFDTLSEYVGRVAFVTVHPPESSSIDYVSIALDHLSVLVRITDVDPSLESAFISFLRTLAAICDVFPIVYDDFSRISKRFHVDLSNGQKDEHRRLIPPVDFLSSRDQIRRMAVFMMQHNDSFAKLARMSYSEVWLPDQSGVSYDFLLWTLWYVSVGYMTMSKFYGLEYDLVNRARLKNQKCEMKGKDFVWLRNIGYGSYGLVQACYNVKYHQVFAIKRPHSRGKSFVDKLKKEYEHLCRFSEHPSIIHVFGWIESENFLGIIQEYAIYGRADRFYNMMPLQCGYVATCYIDILFALRFMHSMGYVYRDFKLANVVMDAGFQAKLIDFGSCCTFEEAPSNLSLNVTRDRWELETEKYHEFTFHTDIGMLERELLRRYPTLQSVGLPVTGEKSGFKGRFSIHSVRFVNGTFIQMLRQIYLTFPINIHMRILLYMKIQGKLETRKDIDVMSEYIAQLWDDYVLRSGNDGDIRRVLARLRETWYEALDRVWDTLQGFLYRDYGKVCVVLTRTFCDAMWITRKWGDMGRDIRNVILVTFEGIAWTREMINLSQEDDILSSMIEFVTYVFQFCDQKEKDACFDLLRTAFRLSVHRNSAGPGVCMALELLKQHRYQEAENILVKAISIGKQGRHDLNRKEHECWMLETGIWALAKVHLDRRLPTFDERKYTKIVSTVQQLGSLSSKSVTGKFRQEPELLIWTVLLAGVDLEKHHLGIADTRVLLDAVLEVHLARPMRCYVVLARWADYLRLEEEKKKAYNAVRWYCFLADMIDGISWPVISTDIWPELLWMRQQAIRYKLIINSQP